MIAPAPGAPPRNEQGFTMVELIVVMLLVGILGAIGAARFFNRSGFDAAAFAEQSAAMLRYAQKMAIAQNRRVHVQASAQGLRLCYTTANPCAAADQVPAPSGASSASSVPGGVAMTLSPASAAAFYFNGLGRPYLAADTGDSSFQGLALTISGDGVTRTISVAQETGYVF
jgi:MSHA pilin protein MshC